MMKISGYPTHGARASMASVMFILFTLFAMTLAGCGEDQPSACAPAKVSGNWQCVCQDDEGERTANVDVNDQLCSGAPLPDGTCTLTGMNGDYCSFECSGLGHADVYCGDGMPSGGGSCEAYVGDNGSCYLACEGVEEVAFACGGNSSGSGSGGNNGGEVCTDGVDNDNDGFVDCNDANCYGHSACSGGSTGSGGGTTCQKSGYWLCTVDGDNCHQELCMNKPVNTTGAAIYKDGYCGETVKVSAASSQSVGGTIHWDWLGDAWGDSVQYQAQPGNPAYADFQAQECLVVVGGASATVTVLPYGGS